MHVHPCWRLEPWTSAPNRRPRVTDHRFLVGAYFVHVTDPPRIFQGALFHPCTNFTRSTQHLIFHIFGVPIVAASDPVHLTNKMYKALCWLSRPCLGPPPAVQSRPVFARLVRHFCEHTLQTLRSCLDLSLPSLFAANECLDVVETSCVQLWSFSLAGCSASYASCVCCCCCCSCCCAIASSATATWKL